MLGIIFIHPHNTNAYDHAQYLFIELTNRYMYVQSEWEQFFTFCGTVLTWADSCYTFVFPAKMNKSSSVTHSYIVLKVISCHFIQNGCISLSYLTSQVNIKHFKTFCEFALLAIVSKLDNPCPRLESTVGCLYKVLNNFDTNLMVID